MNGHLTNLSARYVAQFLDFSKTTTHDEMTFDAESGGENIMCDDDGAHDAVEAMTKGNPFLESEFERAFHVIAAHMPKSGFRVIRQGSRIRFRRLGLVIGGGKG